MKNAYKQGGISHHHIPWSSSVIKILQNVINFIKDFAN